MKHSIRISLSGFTLLALASLAGCGQSFGQFTDEYPKFGAKLSAANFEYVKFGVVGDAHIPAKVEHMIERYEIGLVNEALAKIYAQAPAAGSAIALVNVVVDVSKRTVVEHNFVGGDNASVYDDYITIRADVVRFTSAAAPAPAAPTPPAPATPAPPHGRPKASLRGGEHMPLVFDRSEESVRALAALVRQRIEGASPAM